MSIITELQECCCKEFNQGGGPGYDGRCKTCGWDENMHDLNIEISRLQTALTQIATDAGDATWDGSPAFLRVQSIARAALKTGA